MIGGYLGFRYLFRDWLRGATFEPTVLPRLKELPPEIIALTERMNRMVDDMQLEREQGLRDLRDARDAIVALQRPLADAIVLAGRQMDLHTDYKSLLEDPELKDLLEVPDNAAR